MNDDLTLDLNTRPSTPGDVPEEREAWGNFKLLARVGYGGFGEVYRAWDPALEREVALKLLLPSPNGDNQTDEEYKAMLREARALASVRHPNIVPVYGIDRHDGRVGFWTDFVKGRTLSSLLGSQGPFGYREAALIGLDVTRALSAVHRAGILHRDIKAENVMREEGGRILLMDFGLSTLPHGQANIAGTPNYMAPEVWQGNAASVESDIYAMGVLLFYLVTGEYPAKLSGLSMSEASAALAHRRTLMDLRSDLPESFLRTVGRAIETDPSRRFPSAGQLSEALAESLGTAVPVEAVRTTPVPVASEHEGRPKLSPWMKRGIAAVFVLGAAGLKLPAVRRVLHLDPVADKAAVSAGASTDSSASSSDQYKKAKALLNKSYKDSNIAEAVTLFQSIPKDDPTYGLAQAGLGAAFFKQYKNSGDGKFLDDAKAITNKVLSADKDLIPALLTRSEIEAMGGHASLDMAFHDATHALSLDRTNAEAYAALGEVYQSQGRTNEAVEQIQRAIALEPENSMWPLRLGNYYMVAGDFNNAAAQWQTAVTIDSENTFALYDLGIVNMRMDKLGDARANLQKVLAIQPDAYSYRALGSVFQLEGNYQDAASMDQKSIDLDPSDYQSWASLASVYEWSATQREKSVQTYQKAITLAEEQRKKTPDDAELLADLGNFYASVGDIKASLPPTSKALVLKPDDPNIAYLAGSSYELAGDRTKAIHLIAKALARGVRKNEFTRNPEFASLRGDPSFVAAVNKAQAEIAVDNKAKLN